MKPVLPPTSFKPGALKPALHEKIEQMDDSQLSLLNRVLLQMEAEALADRLGGAFDEDFARGLRERIPELVKTFRREHPYT